MSETKIAIIENIIFMNKQNIPWNQVEQYLKQYVGNEYQIKETGDVIHIAGDFRLFWQKTNVGLKTKQLSMQKTQKKAGIAMIAILQ